MPKRVMGYTGTVAGFRELLARFRREYEPLIKKEAAHRRPRAIAYRLSLSYQTDRRGSRR